MSPRYDNDKEREIKAIKLLGKQIEKVNFTSGIALSLQDDHVLVSECLCFVAWFDHLTLVLGNYLWYFVFSPRSREEEERQ